MKSLVLALLLSLSALAAPQLELSVREVQGKLYVVIEGNEEVTSMQVLTPMDPARYKFFGKRRVILLWPDELPLYPTLFLKVNGKELHYIPELDRRQLQTTSPDPS